MERTVWSSTKWLWLVLALCLIGWRVSNRVDQYHASIVSAERQAQVTFYDANERNVAALDAARSLSRVVAAHMDGLLPVAGMEPSVQPVHETRWDEWAGLPPIYVDSVSLFSNPPPASLS